MNSWKRVAVGSALALSVACCGGDQTTSTTSTAPTTTTTAAYEGCVYLQGLVVVGQGMAGAAVDVLGGEEVANPIPVAEVLEGSIAAPDLEAEIDLLQTTEDPAAISGTLFAGEIPASPIHAMAASAHWKAAPGTDPTSRPGVELPDVPLGVDDQFIGVVDTGLVQESLVGWMSSDFVLHEPALDLETVGASPEQASHGTFVTSIIRQLAPRFSVSFAAARAIPLEQFVQKDDDLPPGVAYLSSELHVADAIVRLTKREGTTGRIMRALNLSLGAYLCDPGSDPELLATLAGLRLWFAASRDSSVFAAGGNETYAAPFWPAALSEHQLDPTIATNLIHGVGAIGDGGDQVVWERDPATNKTIAAIAPTRSWITEVAPGCDLLGLRGGQASDNATVVAWSGSSFASAVAVALTARGTSPTPSVTGGVGIFDYGVDGLDSLYERLGSCDLP